MSIFDSPGAEEAPLLASWNVGDIIIDICDRAGIPLDAIDVRFLDGFVQGFSTTNKSPASSAIQTLSSIYLFDASNFDGALHFVPRGADSIASIVTDDLVENQQERRNTREDSLSIPKVLHIEYLDTQGGLTPDKQTSDRSLDNRSKAEKTLETVVIMGADAAARSVVISHKIAIEEQRGDIMFSLPDSFSWLTVADIILLDSQRLRITNIKIDDGFQDYVARHDRASSYLSTIRGLAPEPPIDPPSLIIARTRVEFIDSHILRDLDDQLGYYIAVASETLNWNGALVQLSRNNGNSWIESDSTTANAIMGELTLALPSHAREYPDNHNTLTVELMREDMTLIPATLEEMQNRINLALVGDELINFSGVNQLSETVWELTGLLRGRKHSEIVDHAPGERFILMNRAKLSFVQAELFDYQSVLTFRAVSFGLTDGDPTSGTLTGRSQLEAAPSYLQAHREGGSLVISWQGVGRLGGGAQVGMGQWFENFRVTVNGADTDTTENTLTITDPGGALTISVKQLNQYTGYGPATSINL